MTNYSRLQDDLIESVGQRSDALAVLLGSDLMIDMARRIEDRAPQWAAVLASDDDDSERADLVVDLMNLLWGDCAPDPEWWQTDLGTACARSLGNEHAQSWTHSIAAGWLGVTTGTIAQLAHRGTLAKHPDGGLVPADVIRYGETRRRA